MSDRKIFSDTERRAASLRQLRFLFGQGTVADCYFAINKQTMFCQSSLDG